MNYKYTTDDYYNALLFKAFKNENSKYCTYYTQTFDDDTLNDILEERKYYLDNQFIWSEENIKRLLYFNKRMQKVEKEKYYQGLEIVKFLSSLKQSNTPFWDVNFDLQIALFSDKIFNYDEDIIGNPFFEIEMHIHGTVGEWYRNIENRENAKPFLDYKTNRKKYYYNRFKPIAKLTLLKT